MGEGSPRGAALEHRRCPHNRRGRPAWPRSGPGGPGRPARSLRTWPSWPLTQLPHHLRGGPAPRRGGCHRSSFLTGFLSAVFQPRAFQPWIHSVTPWRRYWLSVCSSTWCRGASAPPGPGWPPSSPCGCWWSPASPPQMSRSLSRWRSAPRPSRRGRDSAAGAVGIDHHFWGHVSGLEQVEPAVRRAVEGQPAPRSPAGCAA